MPCLSCGKKSGSQAAPMMAAPMMAANPDFVQVIYRGTIGNHYVHSPLRLVRHYGYYSNGDLISVHPSDVRNSPNLFYPASLDVALKVWPEYPEGAPAEVVLAYGVPKAEAPEPEKGAEPEKDDPPSMPEALAPPQPRPKTKKAPTKKVAK